MNIQQSITKKNTRTEILVSEIEKLIVNGSMAPGQRLDEMVLAKNMVFQGRLLERQSVR